MNIIHSGFVAVIFAISAPAPRNVGAQLVGPNEISLAPYVGVQEAWVARYTGPVNSVDKAYAIAVDSSGNVYVTGGSNNDYATVKYNSAGQQEWVANYIGPGNSIDYAIAIATDLAGNVYVTGVSPGAGTLEDYATVKYNSAGQEQWAARYNGPGNGDDRPTGIAVDNSGNVYVTGFTPGAYATIKYNSTGQEQWVARYTEPGINDVAIAIDATGNVYITGSTKHSVGTSYNDYVTIKYNSAGQQRWIARYNGGGPSNARAIAVDGFGNIYVTGESWGARYDYATLKYNSAGQQQWVARYNGPANKGDYPSGIAIDGSGNVYVTGRSLATTFEDFATVKYNSVGQEQWAARYNGPANNGDSANAIAIDVSGNVYVTGSSMGPNTGFDYATIKYNSSGQEEWGARYNGPASAGDFANGIAVDSSGNVYVTGFSTGSGTDADYATIKYTQENTIQVTVNTDPAGLAFNVDGTAYTSTQTFSWASGSSHTIATTSPQNAGTGVRYVWTNWSGGGAISHPVAPTTNTTYTANFRKQYFLTMNRGIGGTVSPSSGWRNSGAVVSTSATPASGYSFSNWNGSGSGSYSGTNNPASITMNGPITETATFTHN